MVSSSASSKGEKIRDVGDPVALALQYNDQGADELVFYDITATSEGRSAMLDIITRTAEMCFMPLTVGGGVRTLADFRTLFLAGATRYQSIRARLRILKWSVKLPSTTARKPSSFRLTLKNAWTVPVGRVRGRGP